MRWFVFSLGVLLAASSCARAQSWTTFKHDNQRTGRTTTIGPQTSNLRWKTLVDGYGIQSPLAIGRGDTIYAGAVDGQFYAFAPDGSIRWQRGLGHHRITAGPAVTRDGTVYVAAENGILHAFNAKGRAKWTFDLQGYAGPSASPAIASDGTIYVGGATLNAINPDGTKKWRYDTGSPIDGPPAIARDGTLYFASNVYLYALAPDGSLKWRTRGHAQYPPGSAPAVARNGTIYINSNDGTLQAFRPDGRLAWRFDTDGVVMDVPSSPALAKDGTIYFGGGGAHDGSGGYLYAVDPSGALEWKYFADCDQTAPTVGGDGTIYFASTTCGTIHALNPDGSLKWGCGNSLDYARSAPVLGSDGTLYAGLLALENQPGQGGVIALGP
jgi:outer membrane protein assembly factor BamB